MKSTISYIDVKTYKGSKSDFWENSQDKNHRKIQQLAVFESPDGTVYLETDPYIPKSNVFTLINQTDNITDVLEESRIVQLNPKKQYLLTICVSNEFKDQNSRVETWTIEFLPKDLPQTKEV